jgi:ribonuclease HIII
MSPTSIQLEAKLKAWRLTGLGDDKLVDEIFRLVFLNDFYQEIWDEPILLELREFIRANLPEIEVYGARLQAINQRTLDAVMINDLFYSLVCADEKFADAFAKFATGLEPERSKMIEGNLRRIRAANLTPIMTIEKAVHEISTQVSALSVSLRSCFEAFRDRQEIGMVNGLLVTKPAGIGLVLPVRSTVQDGTGKVEPGVPTEESFSVAARRAREALQSKGWLSKTQDIIFTVKDTDATYVGSSIALPSAMAIFSSARQWQFDPYTAFTGDIDIRGSQWRIVRVEGIPEKLAAAQGRGIRRIVLPAENKSDVPECLDGLDLVFVDELAEVFRSLTLPQTQHSETIQQQKVLLINALCSDRGWQISAAHEIQKGLQFTITPPTAEHLIINIYDSGAHTPKHHKNSELDGLLQQLDQIDTTETPVQSRNATIAITDQSVRKQIQSQLEVLGPKERKSEQYCDYCLVYENGKEKLIVKQYSSGKLTLQGRAGPLYRKVLEIVIPTYKLHYPSSSVEISDFLSSETRQSESAETTKSLQNEVAVPHIGTDESGKGDYFGPLVIAGVWVDEALQESLAKLGVRDSKKLSDRQCHELATKIRELCQGKYHVVEISPEKYNQLHEQFVREKKTLNHLLAWGHARAIESLLERQACGQAIADQFGDEKYITSKLMEKGKTIQLMQTPKAERFIAVAAASVLARDRFLSRLSQLSTETDVALPKGASEAVIEGGKQIIRKQGVEALRKFAKLHFKTTASVLAERQS